MSGFVEFVLTPEFLTGVSVPLLLGGLAYFSTRNSDTRKMKHEDLKSNRQILRETANEFSAVCSSVFEKAIESKGVFNTIMDFVQNMNEIPDAKAMDKLEYAVDLMEETKRITTAYNHLRVAAPVAVLEKASALNAAVLALCKATTVPLRQAALDVSGGEGDGGLHERGTR